MIRLPPRSTLFPSTPLFRSHKNIQNLPCRATPSTRHSQTPLWLRRGQQSLNSFSRSGCLPPHPLSQRRSEEHTSELQSRQYLVCRLLLEKKKIKIQVMNYCE